MWVFAKDAQFLINLFFNSHVCFFIEIDKAFRGENIIVGYGFGHSACVCKYSINSSAVLNFGEVPPFFKSALACLRSPIKYLLGFSFSTLKWMVFVFTSCRKNALRM